VRRVQRRALERALVDDVDARRYFALAGSLDRYGGTSVSLDASPTLDETDDDPDSDVDTAPESDLDGPLGPDSASASAFASDSDVEGVLPAAMVSLAVVPYLDESHEAPTSPLPSGPPTSAPAPAPWEPTGDTTRPAVRRGARLALRWFDVPLERVAARSGLPEAALTTPRE
jgi:hypothetical protein